MHINVEKIRDDFPILKRKINGKKLIYFDNAATTQKPKQVIDAILEFYKRYNANIHRSIHTLSYEATEAYENARSKVAKFIKASNEEIVWVRNATEGINLIANSLSSFISKNDEILISVMEHHSNLVPWQQIAKKRKAKLKYVGIKSNGLLDLEDLENKLSDRTKIVSITHASNVLGVINPIQKIGKIVKSIGAVFIVDAAQSIPHMPINVKKFNADFIVTSGHKMLGPTGIGFVYGRKDLLYEMEPFLFGGDMIESVTLKQATWNRLPWKFEAGTQHIAGVIGLSKAIDYLKKIGMEKILKHEKELRDYCLNKLEEIYGIRIYTPKTKNVLGIISFNIPKVHPHDVAGFLDNYGIAIRSGHHCAQPLMRVLGIENAARASFYLYNTKEEIDKFYDALLKLKKVFKIN